MRDKHFLAIGVLISALAVSVPAAAFTPKTKIAPQSPEAATAAQEPSPAAKLENAPAKQALAAPAKAAQVAPAKPATAEKKAPGQALGQGSNQPIKITSQTLEADDKAMTVTFSGQVVGIQGDTTLYCDQMVIHYVKGKPKPGQKAEDADREIKKIHVMGHVKVIQGEKTAIGQQGLYEMENNRVVLWGDPKIIQGGNTITGDRVIVYLDTNRALVEGGPKHVQALIQPKSVPQGEPKHAGLKDAVPSTGGSAQTGPSPAPSAAAEALAGATTWPAKNTGQPGTNTRTPATTPADGSGSGGSGRSPLSK